MLHTFTCFAGLVLSLVYMQAINAMPSKNRGNMGANPTE